MQGIMAAWILRMSQTSIAAVAEQYPELKSNENYKEL
jgi:hypothetical protein